ncbi:hypothetical protein DH2020_037008 [Rehmannia glutinosa]|uniref:KIB1-4 beta-propeller domain-containing protein n=1 Tax=Rehmannia glutinosa TaxID=99300 RepID=A0ABR0V4V2_REHGL
MMLPPPAVEEGGGDKFYNFYSVADNKVLTVNKSPVAAAGKSGLDVPDDDAVFVGSSHGWLGLSNKRNHDFFLSNPLSRRHIKIPSIRSLPLPEENWTWPSGHGVLKIIISGSPDEDCRAMMSFGPERRLAFCCPGRSTEWTPIGALVHEDGEIDGLHGITARSYEDYVYSSKERVFFCATQFGCLESWDLRDPGSPRLDWEVNVYDMDVENYPWADRSEEELEIKLMCRNMQYLVFSEQSSQLFLITRLVMEQVLLDGSYVVDLESRIDEGYPHKTIGFDVHRIDREKGELWYMDGSLDGLAFFIGSNHGFALSASDFPGLKPNSIYYTEAKEYTFSNWGNDKNYGGHDIGIFDYGNKTFSSCYYPNDVQNMKKIVPAPFWFTPSPL